MNVKHRNINLKPGILNIRFTLLYSSSYNHTCVETHLLLTWGESPNSRVLKPVSISKLQVPELLPDQTVKDRTKNAALLRKFRQSPDKNVNVRHQSINWGNSDLKYVYFMYKIEKTKKKNAHISVIKLNTICFLIQILVLCEHLLGVLATLETE